VPLFGAKHGWAEAGFLPVNSAGFYEFHGFWVKICPFFRFLGEICPFFRKMILEKD
jgi:hypothetical protein